MASSGPPQLTPPTGQGNRHERDVRPPQATMDVETNALLIDWDLPYGLPPFSQIRPAHFRPAFERAMRLHREELAAIARETAPADVDNTLAAFDRAGALLARIQAVFYNLTASATSPELQAVQREMAAPLAAHWSAVYQDTALFARIDAVHRRREALGLTPEQQRLAERTHLAFVRAGAQLPPAQRARHAALMQRLAELTTAFAQNVLHDEASYLLELPDEASMAGLPDFVRAAARQAAAERGLAGRAVVTLSRSLIVPFLTFSQRRDLREQAWRAWVGRGEQAGEHDNRPIAREILALRREQAQLLGYASYADFALADTMARSRERVWALLDEVWQRALPALERERAMLAEAQAAAGADGPIEGWDWRYWAEQVRQQRYALDEAELKPYFALPNMVVALFDCAQRLFGLRFTRRTDLAAYHEDVLTYEVSDSAGRTIGVFLHDNFSRPSKRSGAWMSALRWQHRNGEDARAVILNNNNFAKAAPGEPTLLSLDDVRTLFHEFGHALHSMLSRVRYRGVARTPQDFVELPSQIMENWAREPDVLRDYAKHYRTGEPIPESEVKKIVGARRFNQGFATTEYLAACLLDMRWHTLKTPVDGVDPVAFERDAMSAIGLPATIAPRYRSPYFQHIFAGGYSSGYYSYVWAEVLDADAFEAFRRKGIFDPATALAFRTEVLEKGGSEDAMTLYRRFRGQEPSVEPLLQRRGLK